MPSFAKYLSAAFHAKPAGMFVAPNWVFLAATAIATIVDPAFLVLGAGLELAYLFALSTNGRFQRLVQGEEIQATKRQWQAQQQLRVNTLNSSDRNRYRNLEDRCRGILGQQKNADIQAADLQAQGEGLARLTWIYLRLLLTRQNIYQVLGDSLAADSADTLGHRLANLGEQMKSPAVSEDVRKSLAGQVEILQQRVEKQKEARDKVAFIEAELTRIEEQVELIREQAAVSADPKAVSDRIDQVAADLTGRSQWLRDQQQVYGKVEDLLAEPPPALDVPTTPEPPPRQ